MTAFILGFGVSFMAGCFPAGSGSEKTTDFPIAKIDGDVSVVFSELYNRLAKSSFLKEGGILDSTIYFDTLKAIVIDSLVSIKANGADLHEDIMLLRDFRLKYHAFYSGQLYKRIIVDSIQLDSAMVDSFYQAHQDEYFLPEQVLAKQLTISAEGLRFGKDSALYRAYSDEELDSIARAQVVQLRERISEGEDFKLMAYEYSVNHATAVKGGELGYFERNTYNHEIDSVAFTLPPGSLSDPFISADGWHLMYVEDHVDSGLPPLSGEQYKIVHHRFKGEKARDLAGQFMDSLFDVAEFEFNDSALMEPVYEVDDTVWSVIVNGRDTIDFYRIPDVFNRYMGFTGLTSLTLDDKHRALIGWAQKYLIIQAGNDLGFDDDPVVAAERERLYHLASMKMIYKGSRDIDYKPTDSVILDYYEKHKPQYVVQKPIKVQHVIVEDSVFGEYLRDLALSGIDFMELVREHYPGEPEIREVAANLGYIGPGEMPEEFFTVAMGLRLGEVSHPVKTEFGYHIIKLLDKRFTKVLEEVRIDIVKELQDRNNKKIYDAWLEKLMEGHRVEYMLEKIPTIELPSKDMR